MQRRADLARASTGRLLTGRLLTGLLLTGLALTALTPSTAHARKPGAAPEAVVFVFARDGADPNLAVRVERDLRNMYDYAHEQDPKRPRIHAIEPRYDVGHLSKSDIEKARRHFNDAQRALETEQPEEAEEQLFRAERFYKKAIPFASDTALLRGIFFYYYLVRQAAGDTDKATERYCGYVALTRNLAGSAGPLEQFEPLADKCGASRIAGTGELRVTANIDGAHVYVDGRAEGVVGTNLPYVNPFLPAGPHLIEVRKAGSLRWGDLVNVSNGGTESVRAQLKPARNRDEEYTPLAELIYRGPDAFSDGYINDLMFQTAELFGINELIAGYIHPTGDGKIALAIYSFGDFGLERFDGVFGDEVDAHRPILTQYWKARFDEALDPADALPTPDRFAPTLFRVE